MWTSFSKSSRWRETYHWKTPPFRCCTWEWFLQLLGEKPNMKIKWETSAWSFQPWRESYIETMALKPVSNTNTKGYGQAQCMLNPAPELNHPPRAQECLPSASLHEQGQCCSSVGFEKAAQAVAETVFKTPLWDIHSKRHSSEKSYSINSLESRMTQSAKQANLSYTS